MNLEHQNNTGLDDALISSTTSLTEKTDVNEGNMEAETHAIKSQPDVDHEEIERMNTLHEEDLEKGNVYYLLYHTHLALSRLLTVPS